MSTHDLLKARLDTVRRYLDKTLDLISEDLYHWAPGEGVRTIHGQLFEILGKEVELLAYARAGGNEEWQEVESFGPREATLAGMREVMREVRSETLAYLDGLSEADLESTVKFPTDWWEGLGRAELPLHEIFRTIAMHEWYHTGQLVTYTWIRGINPYE